MQRGIRLVITSQLLRCSLLTELWLCTLHSEHLVYREAREALKQFSEENFVFNKLKKVIQSRQYLRKICRHLKMVIVRRWYGLKSVHSTFYLGGRADIARDFHAGPYSYVGRDCCICPKVSIGAYTLLAHEVSIQGGDHRYDIPGTPICFSGRPPMLATVIEEDAWIGHRAIIIAGITIGRGAIVGAGAVVTKDVPPYTIVGGIPAKKIGERFPDEFDCIVHDKMLNDEPKEQTLPGWRTPHDY